MDKEELNYNSLIEKTTENGYLVILGQKGTCKTTLLLNLARELRKNSENHVIIFETFPKWIHEFDNIPYMVIKDSDVQPKENMPIMQEDFSYIQWTKDFTILNALEVIKALKENKDIIFLVMCEDMEKISAFMTFVIYQIYRKQYQRAFYGRLERNHESFWFMVEESHNLLDSSTVQKKTFQKLRKIQNEFRNLNMHMVCVALRLQDLSPKIRTKMSIVSSRVSLDDYQLKVRNLLRNSKYRDLITTLPKGKFVFPELDLMLSVQPFKQEGKPQQLKQLIPEQPTETAKPKGKLKLFIEDLDMLFFGHIKQPTNKKTQSFFENENLENEIEEENNQEKENEEFDLEAIEEEMI
jgi:DNA polymerase III delta prime subunit